MNTPAINGPASVYSSPAASKPSDTSNSDIAFQQVLSREVADRNSTDGNKPSPNEAARAAPSSQPAAKPASAKKSDEDKPKESADAAAADAAAADGSTSAQTASAQMLALVADLSNLKLAPAAADTVALKAAASPLAAARKADPLLTGLRDTAEATDAGKDGAIKPETDFAATLKLGVDGKQALDLKAPKGAAAPTTAATASALTADAKTPDGQVVLPAVDLNALKIKEMPAATLAGMAPLQQAAFNTQALAGHASEKLTPQVGTSGWDQALGQKVVWMVAGAQQSATLSLNPPDLGPLQIVLNVSNSQATATFTAAQPEVRQALEAALPRLREMLGDAGIQLGQATVGSGNPNPNSGSGGDRSQQSARGGQSGGDAVATPMRVTRTQATSSGQGLVDTFA